VNVDHWAALGALLVAAVLACVAALVPLPETLVGAFYGAAGTLVTFALGAFGRARGMLPSSASAAPSSSSSPGPRSRHGDSLYPPAGEERDFYPPAGEESDFYPPADDELAEAREGLAEAKKALASDA